MDDESPQTPQNTVPAPEPVSDLQQSPDLTTLAADIKDVKALIEERLRYDEAKEKAFNRLFEELGAAREQLKGDHLQPVFKAMIQLYDHAKSSVEVLDGEGRAHMEVVCEGLLDALYRLDVEVIQEVPERFDRKTQYVVRKVDTNNPDEDWTVERVVHVGFRWRDRVVRPQQVAVRRLNPNVQASQQYVSAEQGPPKSQT